MAEQIHTIEEFRAFVEGCTANCEGCSLHEGTERTRTAFRVVDEVLAQQGERPMPSLDTAHLGDKADALDIRVCMERAGIAVPLGHAATVEFNNDHGAEVIQLDNYR